MPSLKLGKLPDRVPVKITVNISPELNRALAEYAVVYRNTYGVEEPVSELVPQMLETFLAADREFLRARSLLVGNQA